MRIRHFILSVAFLLCSLKGLFAFENNHQGWYWGGEGAFHIFNAGESDNQRTSSNGYDGYGGGGSVWTGHRGKGKWEIKFYLHMAEV